ncbi:MAG: PorT family protein [Bacteroidetes bacterium]|nr:PorT family protein [Bacteroidota bacterium]
MSQSKKNIDHIYRERLLNAEVSPPVKSWEKLEQVLDGDAKSKHLVFYKRMIGAAAVIIILLSVGIGFLTKNKETTPTEISQSVVDSTSIKNDSTPHLIPEIVEENLAKIETDSVVVEQEKSTPIVKPQLASITDKEKAVTRIKNTLTPSISLLANHIIIDYFIPTRINIRGSENLLNQKYYALFGNDLLADNSQEQSGQARKNSWSVGGEISPSHASIPSSRGLDFLMYSDEQGGSLNTISNQEIPVNSYIGGVAVNYILSDKWKVQSGIYYLKKGKEVQNFTVLSNASDDNLLISNTASGVVNFTSETALLNNIPVYQEDLDYPNTASQYNSNLLQQFEFIEIPLILKYKLIDVKVEIYLLGGFNANILIGNQVFLEQDLKNSVGNTSGVNPFIYNSIVGISLEYPIGRKFYFNLSPMFKYQLSSINKNTTSNYIDRFFEYKTGLSYRF